MPIQLQHYASSIASYRVLLYTGLSIGAVLAVVANALKKHSNFYSVAVYLSKSNGTVVVIANFGVLLALLAGRLLQQLFFGPLRPMEVERLYDRMWFFVTESLLAFTIFRDEFDIPFALMFGLLLFTKCFHWLLSDRIEWMDQRPYPGPTVLFHIRIHALVSLLWATDLVVFMLTVENMLTHGVGGTVLFTSEYAILLASLGNSVAKYAIALVDLRRASLRGGENAPPWEDKSMLVFYVELVTDFVKLVTYLTFFMLVLTFYGLPLNIVRDVYITARSFIMRFRDLLRYRTATRNMDERYPNATEEELCNMNDRTCIICRDEMVHPSGASAAESTGEQAQTPAPQDGPNTTPKKLPCGHVFHFYCLRSWLERQQSCPTCRRSVLEGSQPTRPNGQAPRGEAGALPQAPNNVGPVQQFQWQPDQQGNRGGLIGRIMGAAGVPPVGHGQFAPAPLPGQAPQPDGNVIANEQRLLPPLVQPLAYPRQFAAQAQRFAGFFAPDGVWHPWPQAPENANVPNAQQIDAPAPTPTTVAAPNPETEAELPPNADQESVPVGGSTSTTASSSTASLQSHAREAAAAAALRRLSPSSANMTSRHGPTTPDGQALMRLEARLSNMRGMGSRLNSNSPMTSRSNSHTPGSDTSRQTPAPTLIPLFDPHISSSPLLSRMSARLPLGRSSASVPRLLHTTPGLSSTLNTLQGIRELPPTLTDEQLQIFDQLTREAIDERLRMLENVQIMTSRCVMDLIRCRSILPRSNPLARASASQDSSLNTERPEVQERQNPSEETSTISGQESTEDRPGTDESQPPQPVETGA